MRARTHRARTASAVLAAVIASVLGCGRVETQAPVADRSPQLDLSGLLSGETEGYARALERRTFSFPRDHGAHPDFRTEWWYLTGNVESVDGRRFGYQFTLFRNAIATESAPRSSNWATHQLYMGHFALTDVESGRFYAFERFARGAAGLAGVELEPFRAWLEDWVLESERNRGGSSPPPFTLSVAENDIALELELDSLKPLVLQGEDGLSRKGREAGNASYYYALTRLATTGRLRIGNEETTVSGTSWLDREWSTSALEVGQRGWDWFALQLDDGTDLMVYQMRRSDGAPDSTSSGSLVGDGGGRRALDFEDFRLEVLEWWTSPASDVQYPSRWRVTVPGHGLEIEVEPLLSSQELRLSIRYWEGAVRVEGRRNGRPVSGYGYVELTGYDAP